MTTVLKFIVYASGYIFAIGVLALLRVIAQQIRHARSSLEHELRMTRRAIESLIDGGYTPPRTITRASEHEASGMPLI